MLEQFENFIDVLSSGGSQIVWLSTPDVDPPFIAGETGVPPFDEADQKRSARYNELIQQFAEDDDRVVFADFRWTIDEMDLRGADSDLLLADTAEQMRDRGPRALVVTIAGCGHAPALNVPEQLDLVQRFLAGVH